MDDESMNYPFMTFPPPLVRRVMWGKQIEKMTVPLMMMMVVVMAGSG